MNVRRLLVLFILSCITGVRLLMLLLYTATTKTTAIATATTATTIKLASMHFDARYRHLSVSMRTAKLASVALRRAKAETIT